MSNRPQPIPPLANVLSWQTAAVVAAGLAMAGVVAVAGWALVPPPAPSLEPPASAQPGRSPFPSEGRGFGFGGFVDERTLDPPHRYAWTMRRAWRNWDQGDPTRVQEILAGVRPREDDEDRRGFEWHYLWERANPGGYRALHGHTLDVSALVYAPDGRTIVSAGLDGVAVVWDRSTGKPRHVLGLDPDDRGGVLPIGLNHELPGLAIATVSPGSLSDGGPRVGDRIVALIEPNGKRYSTADVSAARFPMWARGRLGSRVEIEVEPEDGGPVRRHALVRRKGGQVFDEARLAFSPDGTLLATGLGNRVLLWDPARGEVVRSLDGPDDRVTRLLFTPDGALVVASSQDGRVHLWDAKTGASAGKLDPPNVSRDSPEDGLQAALSPDGHTLLTTAGQLLTRWDLATRERQSQPLPYRVTAVEYSKDGRSVAFNALGRRPAVVVWDTAAWAERLSLPRAQDGLGSLGFSPDGAALAVGGQDTVARLWDAATGEPLRSFKGYTGEVKTLTFSPDGKTLATGDVAGRLLLWDLTHPPREDRTDRSAPHVVAAMTFANKHLVTAGQSDGFDSPSLAVWDLAEGTPPRWLQAPPTAVEAVEGGRPLAVLQQPRGVGPADLLLSEGDGTTASHRLTDGPASRMTRSPDGRVLAVGSRAASGGRAEVVLADAATGKVLGRVYPGRGALVDLAFVGDGQTLLTAVAEERFRERRIDVRRWEAPTGRPLGRWQEDVPGLAGLAAVTGDRVAVLQSAPRRPGLVTLRDPRTGMLQATLADHDAPVLSLTSSRDGRTVVSADTNGVVKVWDAVGRRQKRTLQGLPGRAYTTAVSADGRLVAVASSFPARCGNDLASLASTLLGPRDVATDVQIWDVKSGKSTGTWRLTTASVALGFDGEVLVTGTAEGALRCWDVVAGREAEPLRAAPPPPAGHTLAVTCLAATPDGRLVATGGWDRVVRLWDMTAGRIVASLPERDEAISCLAFSPDGRTLAVGTGGLVERHRPGELALWDVAGDKLLAARSMSPAGVRAVAFTHDGKSVLLLTAKQDKGRSAALLRADAETAEILATLQENMTTARCLACSPTAAMAIFDADTQPVLISTETEEMRFLRQLGPPRGIRGLAFSPDGRTAAGVNADGTMQLWHEETAEGLLYLTAPAASRCVAFSPDGTLLVVGAGDDSGGRLSLFRARRE